MAINPNVLGGVQAGDYSHSPIYGVDYLYIKSNKDNHPKTVYITPDTVARFNVIEQQTVSDRSGNILGATLLYGLAGTIAASQQVTETVYTIAVDFKDGKSSLIKLIGRGYNIFVNTVSYPIFKSQQLSIPEQIKQLKQLLDNGKITQAEFEIKKRQLL